MMVSPSTSPASPESPGFFSLGGLSTGATSPFSSSPRARVRKPCFPELLSDALARIEREHEHTFADIDDLFLPPLPPGSINPHGAIARPTPVTNDAGVDFEGPATDTSRAWNRGGITNDVHARMMAALEGHTGNESWLVSARANLAADEAAKAEAQAQALAWQMEYEMAAAAEEAAAAAAHDATRELAIELDEIEGDKARMKQRIAAAWASPAAVTALQMQLEELLAREKGVLARLARV
ncbi:MAG: hypothetical protein Q9168_003740 [Polycauliona sp. 1 TL-2023]